MVIFFLITNDVLWIVIFRARVGMGFYIIFSVSRDVFVTACRMSKITCILHANRFSTLLLA